MNHELLNLQYAAYCIQINCYNHHVCCLDNRRLNVNTFGKTKIGL